MKRALSIKIRCVLSALLCALMLCGCMDMYTLMEDTQSDTYTEEYSDTLTEYDTETISETDTETLSETETSTEAETETDIYSETTAQEVFSDTAAESIDNDVILEEGSYTTPEDVAEYIHTFGTLPSNFITKKEAKKLGWDSSKGNLWQVADGMSIGGDHFGNYEGLLPDAEGRKWTECDVNYNGGYRGAERIIFSNDGLIYYTDDHYESFTQLY